MGVLRQITAVTGVSLLGIPRRLGPCSVIVIGVAGVVAVFISVLAMAQGFAETVAKTGRIDRVMIIGKGVDTEAGSTVPRDAVATILSAPQIRTTPAGKPVASADALTFVRLTDRRTGLDAFATLRGVGSQILSLRPEIKLVEGRFFQSGVRELVVGRALEGRLAGLSVGSRLSLPNGDWIVVGSFESGGDSHESELLTDSEMVLNAFERTAFNSITVQLDPTRFDEFKGLLLTNPTVSVDVKRERDYLAEASGPTVRLLRVVAEVIGGIMALGATVAALNAMSSAISVRSVEIATLRAIGYSGAPVLVSIFIEALLLAMLGAFIGAAVAWYFFNGRTASTLSGASSAQMAYVLKVTPSLIFLGIACACAIGFLGGLWPAIRGVRVSVVSALKRV